MGLYFRAISYEGWLNVSYCSIDGQELRGKEPIAEGLRLVRPWLPPSPNTVRTRRNVNHVPHILVVDVSDADV